MSYFIPCCSLEGVGIGLIWLWKSLKSELWVVFWRSKGTMWSEERTRHFPIFHKLILKKERVSKIVDEENGDRVPSTIMYFAFNRKWFNVFLNNCFNISILDTPRSYEKDKVCYGAKFHEIKSLENFNFYFRFPMYMYYFAYLFFKYTF